MYRRPQHLGVDAGSVARYVIACGDPARTEQVAALLEESKLVGSKRGFTIYTGSWKGERVSVVTHGIGAPSAAIVFEELKMLGVETIVRLGTAGSFIQGVGRGSVIIPLAAATVEGYMRSYMRGGSIPAVPDSDLTNRISEYCKANGLKVVRGLVLSNDAFYAESSSFAEEWRGRGVIAVEMECAILFTLALIREFKAAAALIVSNSLVDEAEREIADAASLSPYVEKTAESLLDAMTDLRQRE